MPKTGYAFPDAVDDNIVLLPNYGTNLFRSVTEEQALNLDVSQKTHAVYLTEV
jgi:ribosomal protein L31